MTKKRLLTFCAAAAIAAGALATSALALQGGAPDAGHSYVGVMHTPDHETCSGVLVSPGLFVTAAHCIAKDGELVLLSFDEYANAPSAAGIATRDPNYVQTPGGLSHSDLNDVAVVQIVAGDVPDSHALLPPRTGYDDSLPNNQAIQNVGYGLPTPDVRQVVTEKIIPGGGVTGANFLKISGGNTCFGDSGGPNLQAGTDIVLAINSYGPSASCNAVSYSQRLDTPEVYGFIAGFLG